MRRYRHESDADRQGQEMDRGRAEGLGVAGSQGSLGACFRRFVRDRGRRSKYRYRYPDRNLNM
eukprot:14216956-Alexandrium_andersonii.AAC.1